ncbi:MAG: hypothetical protein SOZ95_00035 [Bacilli bacterium]|nr:hypothetical protein [Bacilli bacterium]
MKKENRFIICICLFIVLSYIIIAIFYNNLSKFYKKEKITNDVMGVILEKNKEHFTLKPFYNEDEYFKKDIYIINKKSKEISASDLIKLEYTDDNINNIKSYKLYKNHNSLAMYSLISYKEHKTESIIIDSLKEYQDFLNEYSLVDAKVYDEIFFQTNSLYIYATDYKKSCKKNDVLNTYIYDDNLYIEVSDNDMDECMNTSRYFIVEDKKDLVFETKIFVNKERLKYYESYNSSKDINIYVWMKNGEYFYAIIDANNVENNLSLISYIEAMPLTINEVSSIIKTKFNNAGIKIVSNIQLTTQKIEEIKKEIGVEDEKEN